jgi:hypothetical protein
MPQPILITGAAGGQQGSTGRLVASFLLKQGVAVRAFVHKLDARFTSVIAAWTEAGVKRSP